MRLSSHSTRPVSPDTERGKDAPRRPAPSASLTLTNTSATTSAPMAAQPSLIDSNLATKRGGRRQMPGETPKTPAYPFPQMTALQRRRDDACDRAARPRLSNHPTVAAADSAVAGTRGRHHANSFTPPAASLAFTADPQYQQQQQPPPPPPHSKKSEATLEYPAPSLYDTILILNSEPGLEQWWARVVQLGRQYFNANRLSLVIPADRTDIHNVPWGQKATFDLAEDADLKSVTYLPCESPGWTREASQRGPADPAWSDASGDNPLRVRGGNVRPKLESRHSFAGFEGRRQPSGGSAMPTRSRPPGPARMRSFLSMDAPPPTPPSASSDEPHPHQQRSHERPTLDRDMSTRRDPHPSMRDFQSLPEGMTRKRSRSGRIVPVLQALDYEAEPLIDAAGVTRVLDRSEIIVLSREFNATSAECASQGRAEESPPKTSKREQQRQQQQQQQLPLPSRPGRSREREGVTQNRPESPSCSRPWLPSLSRWPVPPTPNERGRAGLPSTMPATVPNGRLLDILSVGYEDFEQNPASPWSLSPAASPAIRPDPAANPFFVQANVDDAFEPASTNAGHYSSRQLIEAIGVDKSSSIIHVPLVHPLLSHPNAGASVNYPTTSDDVDSGMPDIAGVLGSPDVPDMLECIAARTREKRKAAIAILSISSSLVPFPRHLVQSLSDLAPHLATSYSLAQHFTDVQSQATNLLSRYWREPTNLDSATADGSEGVPLDEVLPYGVTESTSSTRSAAASTSGSVVSPSERSIGSPGGSLFGTPGWDPSSIGNSGPASHPNEIVDSYFLAPQRQPFLRADRGANLSTGDVAHGQQRQPLQSSSSSSSSIQEGRRAFANGKVFSHPRTTMQAGDDPSSRTMDLALEVPEHFRSGSAEDVPPPNPSESSSTMSTSTDTQTSMSKSTSLEQLGPKPRHPVRLVASSDAVAAAADPSISQTNRATTGATRPRRTGHRTVLHSYGADFAATFQSLPTATSTAPLRQQRPMVGAHARSASESDSGLNPLSFEMPPPSERLLRTMVDAIPAQIFTATPETGKITWVNSKFLAYRGVSVQDFIKDPWQSIHRDERDDYLRVWSGALRNGEQFSYQVRLRRFDGNYRWFYVRAAPLKDKKGITVHWFGNNMDIHDQRMAELSAAHQVKTAASESKYRALANSSPQIVFAVTESKGVIFANSQWRHYSGQVLDDSHGLGFTDHIHPEDLVKCKLPGLRINAESLGTAAKGLGRLRRSPSRASSSSSGLSTLTAETVVETRSSPSLSQQQRLTPSPEGRVEARTRRMQAALVPDSSYVKVTTDNDGRPCYSAEMRFKSKDGEYRWHLVRCVMVDSPSLGDDETWFGTCTDINDHKLMEQKMKEAMESKTKFLSNMSHEIRTPLIGISGMVEFLYHTHLTPEQLDYCDTIWSSSSGLLSIVNDILDLSKIEAGMMSLSHDWFHIRSTIESVNDALSSQAINKGLELNYVVEDDVPPVVRGDQTRIRQVLMNILGNAVKFTARGEVFAHCSLVREPDEALADYEVMLAFEVIDTGAGFSEKDAERIFKPFSQVDASSTRQYGGSGLGLVISRQLVELHGGSMTSSSVPGKGSTFRFQATFILPEADTASTDGRGSAPDIVETPPTGPRLPSPYFSKAFTQSPSGPPTASSGSRGSSMAMSSASSDPSIRSVLSSASSAVPAPAAPKPRSSITDAERPSKGDSTPMLLVMPEHGSGTAAPSSLPESSASLDEAKPVRRSTSDSSLIPRLYSILVICPQPYSLRAITKHIELSLPMKIPHQVTAQGSLLESQRMLGGEPPAIFTHVVVNLPMAEQVIALMEQLFQSPSQGQSGLVILADARMRQEIKKQARERDFCPPEQETRVQFLLKPIKPSRLADIFDPRRERHSSTDRIRLSAEQQTDRRKQAFVEMERNVGNRGHRVLVVEDNPTNQKVMGMFLRKVGVQFELVSDGVEGTQRVFSQDHSTYSLVLCDLQMPNKDGYQTCKEIRQWEQRHHHRNMPIIALSANVIGDVIDRCLDVGFNSYLSKPVEFKALCKAMTELMDPLGSPETIPASR